MKGLIPTLRSLRREPKVYAVVLHSSQGSILHLGIHHSLDEAVEAATPTLMSTGTPIPDENASIDMWTSLEGSQVVETMIEFKVPGLNVSDQAEEKVSNPLSTSDRIEQFKSTKNSLMKALIKEGSLSDIKKTGTLLNSSEKKLIMAKIAQRKKTNEGTKSS